MRKTIIHEYDVEVPGSGEPDEMVDNVVDAMDIADGVMNDTLVINNAYKCFNDSHVTIRETPWAPVSVIERKNENE